MSMARVVRKSETKGSWVWVAVKAGQEKNVMEETHTHLFLPSYGMGAFRHLSQGPWWL